LGGGVSWQSYASFPGPNHQKVTKSNRKRGTTQKEGLFKLGTCRGAKDFCSAGGLLQPGNRREDQGNE